MSFFDWLLGKTQDKDEITELPVTTLNRWFLYDTGMGNENELAEAIGLMPVSDEGDAKEQEDSDIRVENIAYLIPYMDHISSLTAEVVSASQRIAMLEDGADPEEVNSDLTIVKNVYKAIALSSLLSGFSIANHLNFIHAEPDFIVEGSLGDEF
jgi:hypothetical protein